MGRLFITPVVLLFSLASPAQQKFTSIRQVDFKNFTYPLDKSFGVPTTWRWMPLPVHSTFDLVNGRHDSLGFDLVATAYGNMGDQEVAAVDVSYSTGGTANWRYLFLYELEDGQPKLMGWLRSGSRAYGGLIHTAFQDGLLVLDFEDASKREGDCCSDAYIRVSYRWHNDRFAEVSPRQSGTLK